MLARDLARDGQPDVMGSGKLKHEFQEPALFLLYQVGISRSRVESYSDAVVMMAENY